MELKNNKNKLTKNKGNEVIDFRGCYTVMSQGTDLSVMIYTLNK